jgi:hypothetical protein
MRPGLRTVVLPAEPKIPLNLVRILAHLVTVRGKLIGDLPEQRARISVMFAREIARSTLWAVRAAPSAVEARLVHRGRRAG